MGRYGEDPASRPDGHLHSVNDQILGIWRNERTYLFSQNDLSDPKKSAVRVYTSGVNTPQFIVLKSDLEPEVKESDRKFYPAFIYVTELSPSQQEIFHDNTIGFYFIFENKKYIVNFDKMVITPPKKSKKKLPTYIPEMPPLTFQLEH